MVQTPSHFARSLRVRVGRHACRQLGTTGIGVFGAQSSWRSHGAHHGGKGFSRETVGFLLNGASFGTFLSLEKEKYSETLHSNSNPNSPINTNLRITILSGEMSGWRQPTPIQSRTAGAR